MSPTNVRLVAGREIRSLLQKRSFWVGASVTLLIVLAISILPGVLAGDDTTTRTIGLTGETESLAAPLEAADAADDDLVIEIETYANEARTRAAVTDGTLDAAVVGDDLFVEEDDPSPELVALLDGAARIARVDDAIAAGQVEATTAAALTAPQVLTVQALDPADDAERTRQAMTIFGIFLLFAQIFTFGFTVAGGIVEEKSSRVVEILLSKVRATELLTGKILGVLVVTTAQLATFAVVGLGAATLAGTIDLPPGWPGVVALVFGWYLVAYLFFATVFAIAGSLAASPEELQSSVTPVTMLVMIGYGAAVVALNDPNGPVARAASFFPSSAPLVMPLRMVAGDVGAAEIALSVAVTIAIGALLVPVAARVYRGSVLKTRRTGLRDAWRAARA